MQSTEDYAVRTRSHRENASSILYSQTDLKVSASIGIVSGAVLKGREGAGPCLHLKLWAPVPFPNAISNVFLREALKCTTSDGQ